MLNVATIAPTKRNHSQNWIAVIGLIQKGVAATLKGLEHFSTGLGTLRKVLPVRPTGDEKLLDVANHLTIKPNRPVQGKFDPRLGWKIGDELFENCGVIGRVHVVHETDGVTFFINVNSYPCRVEFFPVR